MKSSWLFLRVILFVALLVSNTSLKAQNTDLNAEQVSADYLLIGSLSGKTPIGNYAVLPPMLNSFDESHPFKTDDETLRSFHRYLVGYYAPLFAAPLSSLSSYHAPSNSTTTPLPELSGYRSTMEEGAWLPRLLERYHLYVYGDSTVRLMVDAVGMLRPGNVANSDVNNGDKSESFLLGRLGGRAMGSVGKHFGFMIDLSNGLRFSGVPARIAQTDPVLSRTLKFAIEDQKYFDRYIGYVQYQSEHLRVRFGRETYSWGFSPIDNLVHSRYAPLQDAVLLDVPYKAVRFTSVHAAVEGLDINNNAVSSKFISSHRVQIDAAEWMSLAINDMIVYSGRGLDFAYLNPLGFYVSTGLGTKQKSDEDNSLLAAEFIIRPFTGSTLYGSLLADDIGFGTLTDSSVNGNNNKYAFQLGSSHLLHLLPQPLLITAEYVRVTPFTYSHRKVNNSWTHLGAPIGYNIQPNSDRLAVQAKYWFSARNFLQVDFDYTRWGENILDAKGNVLTVDTTIGGTALRATIGNMGGDMLRGDGDFLPFPFSVGNAFLRGRVSHTRRIQAWLSTEVFPNIFVDTRLQYLNRNGGNAPISTTWATVELRVGY